MHRYRSWMETFDQHLTYSSLEPICRQSRRQRNGSLDQLPFMRGTSYRRCQLRQPKNDNNVNLHRNRVVVQLVRLITPLAHGTYCRVDKQRVTSDYPHLLNLPICANCCPKCNCTINSRHAGLSRVDWLHLVLQPAWRDALESQRRCGQGCRN